MKENVIITFQTIRFMAAQSLRLVLTVTTISQIKILIDIKSQITSGVQLTINLQTQRLIDQPTYVLHFHYHFFRILTEWSSSSIWYLPRVVSENFLLHPVLTTQQKYNMHATEWPAVFTGSRQHIIIRYTLIWTFPDFWNVQSFLTHL
jgi:hypothetical protein